MEKFFLLFKNMTLFLGIFSLVLFSSCGDDDKELPVAPTISIDGATTIISKSGENFSVDLTLNAPGGNKELVVSTNGGLLETVTLDADITSFTYNTQQVPSDAEEGEEFEFQFSLTDLANQESPEVDFIINAALYDQVVIGGESLYNVTIPADGIVTGGTSVKFITGRNYYITEPLSFESGSSFTIEEGVAVYMEKPTEENELDVEINLNSGTVVSITGTNTAPVVMTPSTVLTGDPQPGDWNRLDLDGTTNAVVRYLRTEYASEGMRMDDLNNTNTIEYVQTYLSKDEGVYITDGDLNVKYIINTRSGDTGFRLGDNYQGTLQFIINHGSEHGETDFHVRETAGIVAANMTLIGAGQEAAEGDDVLEIDAINNTFKIYNTIVTEALDEDLKFDAGDMDITDLSGTNVLAYSYFFNNNDPLKDNAVDFFGTFDETGALLTNPFFNNALSGGPDPKNIVFEVIDGIGVNDFIPDAEQPAKENFDPATVNDIFVSAPFVGAVRDAANDWTVGWVKNIDGTIR
ncbi:hypothetical protein FNH22_24615 [Fulvivirga sp. M361]|uniref:hypothetical protein n=1 Tax=Fulvivirga sp. M361 TaxID=2594266 RepID=UPI00117AFDC0|nr:hypothetical protein [Fulvivirga sp. M361]TRX51180.1 hypothetical protein FNH22_24615 [Fulvivirga sp. M361]